MNKIRTFLLTALCLLTIAVGFFSFLNNIHDYPGVIERFVKPLLTMSQIPHSIATYRAIHLPWLWHCLYFLMMTLEAMVGAIGLLSLIFLLYRKTNQAIQWLQIAAIWGIIYWGLFFFVIRGDWFISWKSEELKYIQSDAIRYVNLMLAILIALEALKNIPHKAAERCT